MFGLQGQTALHHVAKLGGNAADHAWLVAFLMNEGALPDVPDNKVRVHCCVLNLQGYASRASRLLQGEKPSDVARACSSVFFSKVVKPCEQAFAKVMLQLHA